MHLFFDPVLLSVPASPGASAQVHLEYAERLVAWDEVTRGQQHSFCVSAGLADALYQDECYPNTHTLRRRWKDAGVRLSPDTAAKVALRLLTSRPPLETFFAHDLARVQVDKITLAPDLSARLPKRVAATFRDSLARVAWLRRVSTQATPNDPNPANLLLVTHPIGDATTSTIQADVLADDVAAVEVVEDELPLVTDPQELDRYFDLNTAWTDPATAIRLLARQILTAPSHAPVWQRIARFRVGDDFSASIQRCEIHRKAGYLRKVFRLCVLLMADDSSTHDEKQHHRLGKGSVPISHGVWQAWRLWINDAAPGYRLHYWRNDNEFIFMHVRFHDDYTIDPPS
jgi:hypothetical protein